MARGQVVRDGDEVTCTGLRWWLRARPAPEGGLLVESAGRVAATWQRIDRDVTLLVRSVTRLRIHDAAAVTRLAQEVSDVVGVRAVDPDPVLALVRATYPLLATGVGDRLPGIPAVVPGHLQEVFRQGRPRDAATLLFGDRATRPVVRTLCACLDHREVPDLFALTAVAGVAPVLQPDHLGTLLDGARDVVSAEVAPLTRRQMHGLAAAVRDADPRRTVRLLGEALADDAHRERLRFIAEERDASDPGLDEVADWEQLALHVALSAGGVDEVVA